MRKFRIIQMTMLALALVCFPAGAQEIDSPPEDGPLIPADEFDRGTPSRTGDGFMAAVDSGDYETAVEYMDLRNLRGVAVELTGAQLARRLFVIINRATWIDIDELVDDPDGRSNDNLPEYRDSIGIVRDGDNEIRLLMQKVPRGDGVFIWKISNATVALIPELYDRYGYPEVVEELRRNLPNVSFLGFELFKWVIAVGAGAISYSVIFLIALAIRRLLGEPDASSHRQIYRFIVLPVGIWSVVMAMSTVGSSLGRGVTAETLQRVSPLSILITVWLIFASVNLFRDVYSERLLHRQRSGAAILLRPAGNAFKLLVAVAAVLIYLDKLGINITTVLAGLGVGGIAVALALQKPMEDVFGAITLYTQQPVRVGDFCRVGTETGTIEEIGLRTTRLRTLADTLIAIPNARLANEPIDNISARKKILFRTNLRLKYDTSAAQLQQILEGIRELFASFEKVLPEGHRVRFKEISDDALLVELNAYLDTTSWPEYLELAEQLNIQLLDIVAKAGTSLALPAQALHIEQAEDDGKTEPG